MRETEPMSPGSRDDAAPEPEPLDEIEALEEALTVAAAAPGRRRLERLELLLLERATHATRG
jgi:hypothetical protein